MLYLNVCAGRSILFRYREPLISSKDGERILLGPRDGASTSSIHRRLLPGGLKRVDYQRARITHIYLTDCALACSYRDTDLQPVVMLRSAAWSTHTPHRIMGRFRVDWKATDGRLIWTANLWSHMPPCPDDDTWVHRHRVLPADIIRMTDLFKPLADPSANLGL